VCTCKPPSGVLAPTFVWPWSSRAEPVARGTTPSFADIFRSSCGLCELS
jgi:hypothetical protein